MKRFVFVLGLVLMLGVVSAHYDVGYKESFSEVSYHGGKVFSKTTTWVDYNNDKRYSTYDYRGGYSYRATRDYFERYYDLDEDRYDVKYERKYEDRDDRKYERKYEDWDEGRHWDRYDPGIKGYRYDYVPHLRTYEKTACYVNPPSDKLFYIKC